MHIFTLGRVQENAILLEEATRTGAMARKMEKNNLHILKHIGRGKSGDSYLSKCDGEFYVLKEMHDEQVPYFQFESTKMAHELKSYEILQKTGLNLPRLISYSNSENYLIKEYIDGMTISERLVRGALDDAIINQMLEIEKSLSARNINIDYFPNNFVIASDGIYYIDYETNNYSEEWNFSNWGIYYWLNHEGFRDFLSTKDPDSINTPGTGKPRIDETLEKRRRRFVAPLAE